MTVSEGRNVEKIKKENIKNYYYLCSTQCHGSWRSVLILSTSFKKLKV